MSMAHGVTCVCNGCHRLRSKALSEPGRYGRIYGGYCTDCRGPADPFPVRNTAHYPICKKCRFERFQRLDFAAFALDAPQPRAPPGSERQRAEPQPIGPIVQDVIRKIPLDEN